MATKKQRRLPAGVQPYDPLNGLRIGALAGGILGALIGAATNITTAWIVLGGGVIGGAIGYVSEKRKLRQPPRGSSEDHSDV